MISTIETERVTFTLRERFRTAVRQTDTVEALRVIVGASDGAIGVGYGTATPAITGDTLDRMEVHIRSRIEPLILGRFVDDAALFSDLAKLTHLSPSATAAVDMAAYDLHHQYATGEAAITAASSSVKTSVTVSADSAEAMVSSAVERIRAGFSVLKLKLGVDPDGDVDRLRRVTDAASGRAEIWVDANQGWTKLQALHFMEEAARAGVAPGMLEQPVAASAFDDLAEIAANVSIPVTADESAKTLDDIRRIADNGSVRAVNIKLMKFGGMTGAQQAGALAASLGLDVLVGSMMEHPASLACAVRFAASLFPHAVHDLDAAWWMADPSPCSYSNGRVYV